MRVNLTRLILACLVLGAAVSALQGVTNALRPEGSQDFQWGPAAALLAHQDPYALYLQSPGKFPFLLSQAPNYPVSGLVLLWPYAAVSWTVAKIAWAASNLVFTAVILWGLFRLLPDRTSAAAKTTLAAVFVMGTPWRNAVGNGQHSLLALAFFLWAVVLLAERPPRSALPLAVSWFKYTLALPLSLFFLFARRGWVPWLLAAGVHVPLTIFAAVWVGASPVDLLLGPIEVARSATGQGHLDVFAIVSKFELPSRAVPFTAALFILCVTWWTKKRDREVLSCLSTLALVSMTVVFHAGYDFVVLVIPLAYALRERARTWRTRSYLAVVGLNWFAQKVVDLAGSRGWFGSFDWFPAFFFWFTVFVYYGSIALDWSQKLPNDEVRID